MTAWTPAAAVSIAGTDYTDETVVGATVSMGRPDVYQQPQAGYARISLVTTVDAAKPIKVTDPVQLTLNSTLGPVPVFTGTISDVTTTVTDAGPSGILTRIDLLAVGPLALLNRRTIDASSWPAEGDGTRVSRILDGIYRATWATYTPATATWASVPATTTWASVDPAIGSVDTPGVYTVTADNSGTQNGYQTAATVAKSGLGVLYEGANGTINYDDADHRQDNASLNGYITLTQDAIGSQGLTTASKYGTIVNALTLTYGANQSVTVEDAASIAVYGRLAATINTELNTLADATEQAERYLQLWATPRAALERISIPVHNAALTTALRNQLLAIYNGAPVQIPQLPAVLGGSFQGFVEGWTWRIGRATADLELAISELQQSVIPTKWVNVVPTETWSTIEPTLVWEDALVVA